VNVYRIEDLPASLAAKILVNPVTGCWEWQRAISRDGYGRVWWQGSMRMAHRVVYTLLAGPIPDDRPQLDHVKERGCASNHCCWPVHLEPVTHQENIRRSKCISVINAAKTHCPSGHEYDLINTYWAADGRHCRACVQARKETAK
jgi:hypothetical protein